jgi:hypothetical protein
MNAIKMLWGCGSGCSWIGKAEMIWYIQIQPDNPHGL